MNTSPAPQGQTDNNFETQRGIDTRIMDAGKRLRKAEAAYWEDPTDHARRDEYLAAQEELRALRAKPMQSLAPMKGKRFVNLEGI